MPLRRQNLPILRIKSNAGRKQGLRLMPDTHGHCPQYPEGLEIQKTDFLAKDILNVAIGADLDLSGLKASRLPSKKR